MSGGTRIDDEFHGIDRPNVQLCEYYMGNIRANFSVNEEFWVYYIAQGSAVLFTGDRDQSDHPGLVGDTTAG